MKFASVDPGANGAIIVWDDNVPIDVVRLSDVLGSQSEQKRLRGVQQLQGITFAVIERVRGMTHDSAASAYNFGWCCGILHQYFDETEYVAPLQWMNVMHRGLPKSMPTKERSYDIACRLYPEFLDKHKAHRKKDDGIHDALLIGAWYLWETKRKTS